MKVECLVSSVTRNIRLNDAASVGITEAGIFDLVRARSDTTGHSRQDLSGAREISTAKNYSAISPNEEESSRNSDIDVRRARCLFHIIQAVRSKTMQVSCRPGMNDDL